MKFMFPRGLAILASVNFIFATLLVGHSAGQSADDTLRVTIRSAQGRETHPQLRNRTMDRVSLRPGEVVSIALQLPPSFAGQPVAIGSLDGGQVVARNDLAVSAAGKVQCNFQAGPTLGLYRVSLQIGVEEYLLQFFVRDPDHPEANPTRPPIRN